MKCSFCNKKAATHTCGQCELVVYCGEECATRDWIQIHAREHSSDERNADEIIPGLWVGGLEALRDKTLMKRIRAVVSAVPEDRFKEEQLKDVLGDRSLLRVPIEDAEEAPIENYFEKVADFIDGHLGEGHQVLVHCVAGHSRSVSLIIYYLMKRKEGYTLRNAFRLVRKKRPTIKVNKGFKQKLKEAELQT